MLDPDSVGQTLTDRTRIPDVGKIALPCDRLLRKETASSTDLSALVHSCFPPLLPRSFPFLASGSRRFFHFVPHIPMNATRKTTEKRHRADRETGLSPSMTSISIELPVSQCHSEAKTTIPNVKGDAGFLINNNFRKLFLFIPIEPFLFK
jgi:hypothetical protein